jgi:serine/threonine protein kinase/ABC-type branched-subunit amino acid transport system ATPase component
MEAVRGMGGDAPVPAAAGSERACPPILELIDIESMGALEPLHGANFAIERGELVGLCGENGGGKATLVKILAGAQRSGTYRGQVLVNGRPRDLTSEASARRAGIAVIHQRPPLVPRLSVAHNLMLGREPRRYGLVDEARLELLAREHLERFGFADEIEASLPVEELDVGGRQILEMMRAQLEGAEVLILEEPAALLTPRARQRLFDWLRSLHRQGVTCIYVSDRLDEVIGLCDRVIVLRDGKTAQTLKGSAPARASSRGRYTVHDEIASGGMATVHLGTVLGPFGFSRTVAVKRLHPTLSRDPEFVAMFIDEARLASRIRHPNVVSVLDVYAEEGGPSLVMEYIDGESLARLLRLMSDRRAYVPVGIAVSIVASVLHGLHAAHEARDEQGRLLGLVHRDVSPQNVIVGSDGIPRLIDFGIAKAAGRANVTREGQLKGKLPYMAPEQLQGKAVTPRTDVYGASVLLWELLVGARLFHGDGHADIMGLVLSQPVLAPGSRRPDIPASLDAIALRGLDRNPERRFATAHEMALELERWCQLATAAEIASWVQSTAQSSLAERRQKVALLERQSSRRTSVVDRGERGSVASPRIDGRREEGSTRVESARRPPRSFITRAWARIFGS